MNEVTNTESGRAPRPQPPAPHQQRPLSSVCAPPPSPPAARREAPSASLHLLSGKRAGQPLTEEQSAGKNFLKQRGNRTVRNKEIAVWGGGAVASSQSHELRQKARNWKLVAVLRGPGVTGLVQGLVRGTLLGTVGAGVEVRLSREMGTPVSSAAQTHTW